jgi:hypothetical protein
MYDVLARHSLSGLDWYLSVKLARMKRFRTIVLAVTLVNTTPFPWSQQNTSFQSAAECFAKVSDNEDLDFRLELGWKLANSAKGPNHSSIAEYVREGDDINNWKELVTLQTWGKSSHQPPPDEMLKSLQTTRDKECPNSTLWNVIAKEATSILYEWHAKPCLGWPEQCEIARLIIGNRLVFALRYAAKRPQLPPETRSKWIKTFSEVTILGKH